MNKWYRLCAFSALASLWSIVGSTHAQESPGKIEVSPLWKTFSAADINEVTAITLGRDGKYLAIGSTYSSEQGESHWWGELDAAGKKVREVKDWDPRGFKNGTVVALRQTSDQSIWVIGERTVSKFTPERTLIFSESAYKISPLDRYSLGISAAVDTGDGGLMLAGFTGQTKEAFDAWLMKIDSAGKKVWEKSFDYGQDEWILHAVRKKNQFVLTAVSGKFNKFGAGFDGVLLIAFSEQGKQIGKYAAKGSIFPRGVPTVVMEDGSVVVAYSRSSFPMRDAWLLCLDSSLKKVWEKQVAKPQATAFTPSVSRSSASALVVTWNGMNDFRLWGYDMDGNKLSEDSHRGARGFYVPKPSGGGQLFLQKMKSF